MALSVAGRRARDVLILGVLLAIPVLVLRAQSRSPSELTWLDRAVLRVSAPVQSGITRAAEAVGDRFHRYVWLVDVQTQNQKLREENARLRAELDHEKMAVARVGELEQKLGLRRKVPSETLAARVVGVESSAYFRVVRVKLDRGEGEVRPGMPVLVPEGVVGSVRRVFGPYCDVLLATDPESSIDVVSTRTGAQGTLRGVSGAVQLRARFLRAEDVREGDDIRTSGNDGVFPRDLPIGQVVRASAPEAGLWRETDIKPAVDFTRLSEVLVVLAPPPPPDPDAGRRAPAPHRGLGVPE